MNLFEYMGWLEDEAMRLGNHAIDRLLVSYLLRRVDADSGVVGERSSLARGRIALDLSEKGGSGKRKALVTYTDDDVDNSLRRMEKHGLLRRLSAHGRLVVQFIFPTENGTSPFYAQNEVTTRLRRGYDTKNVKNHGTCDVMQCVGDSQVTTILPTIHPSTQGGSDGTFAMHMDWMPTDGFKGKVSKMVNVTPALETAINLKLLEYVMFWSLPENQRTRKTQAGWELHFMRNDLARVIRGDVVKQAPVARQGQARALSVPNLHGDELQAWARRNGLPDANSGELDWQYMGRLRHLVARKNDGADGRRVH